MDHLPWLSDHDLNFPDISDALAEPNGLLAAGGDLSSSRLLKAYSSGIFPWFDDEQPILWWSPDPRCVIDPASFTASRSLRRRLRRGDFSLKIDTAFPEVISQCRSRGGVNDSDEGTWITRDMREAYCQLHAEGFAHSFECYIDGELAGGLYGVSLGNLFFGESMFHRRTDASKLAFAGLMAVMARLNCPMVDCQIGNDHLYSLGATDIPRDVFRRFLEASAVATPINWKLLQGDLPLEVLSTVL